MRGLIIILIATTAFASVGCDAFFDKGCSEDTARWIEYRLFMGRRRTRRRHRGRC